MALIKCKECSKEISSDAKECPHCGKKVKKGMSCLMMIGVVMAIFVFFAMIKACDTGTSGSPGADSDAIQHADAQKKREAPASDVKKESGSKEKAPEKSAAIGDEIQVGNMAFKVNEVGFLKTIGNEMVNETADGVFMLLSVTLMNTGKKSMTIDNSLFKLQDANGAEYEFSSRGATTLEMIGKTTLFLKQCQPNIATSGILIFEVPSESEYILNVSDGMWSSNSGKVVLKNSK